MEDTNTQGFEPKFEKDIFFYRGASFSILSGGSFDISPLCMNAYQINFLREFVAKTYFRPLTPEDLMLADGYCELISGTAQSVAIRELLLNDEYIAKVYAELMSKRHELYPSYETPPSIAGIFDLICRVSAQNENNRFPYSELDVFSSLDNESAMLKSLSRGCKPIAVQNGVCIGQKLYAPKFRASDATAVIYAPAGQSPSALSDFLESYALISSSASAELCKTIEIFPKLIQRYDEIDIDTLALPKSRGTRYGNRPYIGSEAFYADICESFFTNELFGDTVILLHGSKSALNRLCSVAVKMKLSFFGNIYAHKNSRRASKKKTSLTVVRIKSDLFRFLAELGDNLKITLPDHDTSAHSASEVIPEIKEIFTSGNDSFYRAETALSSSPLPFHSGFYSVAAPVAFAHSARNITTAGQLTLSVKAALCFSDAESAGRSLSALLGLYDASSRLSAYITDSQLYFTDKDSMALAVTAHDFSEKAARPSLQGDKILHSLAENPNALAPNMLAKADFFQKIQ